MNCVELDSVEGVFAVQCVFVMAKSAYRDDLPFTVGAHRVNDWGASRPAGRCAPRAAWRLEVVG